MAEFCLECWNKMNDTNHSKIKYIISKDCDVCEGCGQLKNVIVMERWSYYKHKFFLLKIIDLFIAILMLPVSFYKRIRTNLKNRHSDT